MKPFKWTVLSLVLIVGVSAIAAQTVTVRELSRKQGGYTTNAGELVGGSLVGQTFLATKDKLSAVAVKMATYSGRENTKPVEFHLRRSIDDQVDLRKVTVDPESFGDNQFYTFSFEPVVGSRGETYFFFLISPASVKGDAVTVDIDARDPYHRGSAYMVRGQGGDATNAQVLARSGKAGVDVAFADYYTVRLREAVINESVSMGRAFINTWGESKAVYWLWLKAAVPSVLLIVFILLAAGIKDLRADKSKRLIGWMLLALFVLAMAVRIMYAVEMPVTNDEGNYLYDARTLIKGKLAGGDGYVKAPLVVLWIAMWQALLGGSLLAGRLSSALAGSLVIWPIYILGREIGGRRAGVASAALWALLGVTTVFNTYVHTQPLAVFFGVSGLAVLFMALRGTVPRMAAKAGKQVSAKANWFFLAGVLLGLGVISRKSILALGLVPIILILIEGKFWSRRIGHFLQVGMGFLLVIFIFLTLASLVYGVEGFWEAVGVNSAEDGISAVEESQREQVRAYSLRGMTPFFRESLPLIMLAVIGLGVAIERLIGAVLKVIARKIKIVSVAGVDYVLSKLGWALPLIVFWWAWSFFSEYEGSSVMVFGMELLWYAMFGLVVLTALLPRARGKGDRNMGQAAVSIFEAKKRELSLSVDTEEPGGIENEAIWGIKRYVSGALLSIAWLGGLVFFYMNWIKFHANYIGEFLPPLVILAGVGAPAMWLRCKNLSKLRRMRWLSAMPIRLLLAGIVLVVWMWSMFASGYVTYVFEHTGTFQIKAAHEAADWAREYIPVDQSIFTGAALIPYLSGHDTALDIAHPRWYAYEFTRSDASRLNTFLPSVDEMVQAFRDAEWLLLDKQTGFSFLMEYSEIEGGLEKDFTAVKGISNGSNTLTFYRRVR